MSKFMEVYEPVNEGVFSKLWGLNIKIGKAANKTINNAKADKRDNPVKIVLILEDNFKNKDWDKPLYAWNEEDFRHIAIYHGIKRQIPGSDCNDKRVVMPESTWNKFADHKILVFKVKREDCKKTDEIVSHPFVSWMYKTSKDKLKQQSKAIKVRDLIKQSGLDITTPWNGPLKPGKPLK